MRCSKCGMENREGSKYCNDCGAPLASACPACGATNKAGAKFCNECGGPLDAALRTPEPVGSTVQPRETGERRHLTVLFCDLVGSTQIAAQLDPEEWRETVAGYHRAAAEAITRFGGHVAKYLGDGVMAFFGYPEAHDNDAERAARAGLAILDAVAKLNEQPGRPRLAARVGIHSGTVVVGAGAGEEADVFGDAPNIAARVQEAAAPGTVAVTEDTHRLISGLFVVEGLGTPALKGVERSLQLYRVVQPSGVRGRLEAAAAARGLTPFVGREDELRLLMGRWERVLEGEGQVVLIVGEAGIGKSRLVQHFHELIAGTPHTSIEAATAPFFQNTPFCPVAEMLKQVFGWRGDKSGEEQVAQLESALETAGLKPAEAIPLIAPLLNLPLPAKYPPSALSAEQQRRRLLATLVELALGAARVQPTLITTEDLHWADPSTLELIQLLVEQGARARLLLLYTARPEFRAQWPLRAHHTQITLNRLSARNVRTMVQEVAARAALSEDTITTVVERTGGVPLFVEELTRAVLESGDSTRTGREIPITLHDSLMARLDRLGPAKEVIQVGAVIGSEFSYELLHAVHPLAEDDLQDALRALADAELVYVRGMAPEATYQFKHALIRDAAYEALLKSRRKELHARVARTIGEQFPDMKELHPEGLARHWTEAGEIEPAIAEWTRAGKAAEARSAWVEVQESLQQALTLLELLPESRERDARELELRQSLVLTLQLTRGWVGPETVEATARIGLLAERTGNLEQLFSWVFRRCLDACLTGDLSTASLLADQTLELALREGSPRTIGAGHMIQILVRYQRGDLAEAEKNFEAGLKFVDNPAFRESPFGGSSDHHARKRRRLVTIAFFGWASWNVCTLGRSDAARERLTKMRAAVNPANPHDLAWSDLLAAIVHTRMREYENAEALAARALDLCEEHRFPSEAATARCVLGVARAQLGRVADGIALIRQGMDTTVQLGSRLNIPSVMTNLATAQLRAGAIRDALETVEQALNFNPEDVVARPDTLRIRGELRLKQRLTELAETDFRDSIALAQKMGAKAWELRAALSLARLLDKTGRRDEARTMLAEIYGWFTEGFDTPDLEDAKALLEELAS